MHCQVSSMVLDQMRAEAMRAAPEECCGLLLGERCGEAAIIRQIAPAPNIHPCPRSRFSIDPRALIAAHKAARSGGPAVLGHYHSHPIGPPAPSATDQAMAARDGSIWAIIALGRPGGGAHGPDSICLWRDGAHTFEALCYQVTTFQSGF